MAIHHRKLLPAPDSNQPVDCSDCDETCAYACTYPEFDWPPQPPLLPPSSTTIDDGTTTQISPYLIIIVATIGTAVLFTSYYFIMIRYCTRFRRPPAIQVNEESQDFINEDHWPEIDHPIWYITTVGLPPSVISSITVVKFEKGNNLIDGTDCSVCLSEFEDDESLKLLPKCNHAFHIPCIDTWLRSHTNCPLCRAPIVSTNSNAISGSNDRNRNHGSGLNRNTQMENVENDGELSSNHSMERGNFENRGEMGETRDSKPAIENAITVTRSLSMDSAVEVPTETNVSNSTVDLQSLNHLRDSRTRTMMRSFSYGGNL